MLHRAHLLLLAFSLSLVACSEPDPHTRISSALSHDVYQPAFAAWAKTSQQLSASADALCQGSADLAQARQSLLNTQRAWAALQPLQIGLITEGNRSWQVQFWPDKKNLVARQVETLLKSKPQPSQTDLEQASVVVQGLSAYEYLLFDPAIDLNKASDKGRYCALLKAIAIHQKNLADLTLQDWQTPDGIASQLDAFPNQRYARAQDAIADLLRSQVTGLDVLKKKLGIPLGMQSKGLPQPYQADAWRSNGSLGNISAGIASARSVWQGRPDGGLRDLLTADQQALASEIDNAYASTDQQLAALQQPMAELLASQAGRNQLIELYDSLLQLHRLHERELAKALGVQLGFNAHDGD